MDSRLNSQNFIRYESAYESYKFLMNSHLDPPESDPLTALNTITRKRNEHDLKKWTRNGDGI
jgi:hypothetical protein